MDKRMNAAEAEDKRKADLKARLAGVKAADLPAYAAELGVTVDDKAKAEDIIAAIELHEEAKAKKANDDAARRAIAEMEEQERLAAKKPDDEVAKVVRRVTENFSRDIPQDARGGAWDVPEGHDRFGGDYDVPNGRYRLTGSEWLLDFKGKKLVGVERATAANKYGGAAVKHVG